MKTTSLVFFLLLSLNAYAADWKIITGEAGKGNVLMVDESSASSSNGYRKAWFLWNFERRQLLDTASRSSGAYRSSKVLMYFNCAEKSLMLANVTYYSGVVGTGTVAGSSNHRVVASNFSDVIPETNGDAMYEFACSKKPNESQ